jgi:hypothetical protein
MQLMEAAEALAEMVCENSPLAVQAAVRLYKLSAAFSPSLASYARHLDQEIAESEDGAVPCLSTQHFSAVRTTAQDKRRPIGNNLETHGFLAWKLQETRTPAGNLTSLTNSTR